MSQHPKPEHGHAPTPAAHGHESHSHTPAPHGHGHGGDHGHGHQGTEFLSCPGEDGIFGLGSPSWGERRSEDFKPRRANPDRPGELFYWFARGTLAFLGLWGVFTSYPLACLVAASLIPILGIRLTAPVKKK